MAEVKDNWADQGSSRRCKIEEMELWWPAGLSESRKAPLCAPSWFMISRETLHSDGFGSKVNGHLLNDCEELLHPCRRHVVLSHKTQTLPIFPSLPFFPPYHAFVQQLPNRIPTESIQLTNTSQWVSQLPSTRPPAASTSNLLACK